MTATAYAATRALTLRLRRGDDVLIAVAEALARHGIGQAWITARGTFDEIELRDQGQQRTFATTSRILAFDGRARAPGDAESPDGEVHFAATVARPGPRGPELLMGDVLRAIAHDVELLITALEPEAANEHAGREGREDRDEEAPASPRADDPWAMAAAASAESEAEDRAAAAAARVAASRAAAVNKAKPTPSVSAAIPALPKPAAPVPPKRKTFDESPYPEEGDLIDHFAFGRADVLRSDGDELLVHDAASGRTRTLRIGVLAITGPFEEEGRKLYRLRQRRTTS